MDYRFNEDLKCVLEMLNISEATLASALHCKPSTINKYISLSSNTNPSKDILENFYNFSFRNNINFGRLKSLLYNDTTSTNHKILFHGSKNGIEGKLDINNGRKNKEIGIGFYVYDSYEQAITYASFYNDSSLYYIDFDNTNLVEIKYEINTDWILTLAYYRGKLDVYKNHPLIQRLVKESNECDYIVSPVIDNRGFSIIEDFIRGLITDEQCKHCLAATNLGYQHIFKKEKCINQIKLLEQHYICREEKEFYKNIRINETKLGEDKVKLARIQYKRDGLYIDEILGK